LAAARAALAESLLEAGVPVAVRQVETCSLASQLVPALQDKAQAAAMVLMG
jgi:hypothetical protein